MTRRNARIAVVQALYQFNLSLYKEPTPKDIIDEFIYFREGKVASFHNIGHKFDLELFQELCTKSIENILQIDELLKNQLPNTWPFDRIDLSIISILRAGIAELLFFPGTPFKVILNEYIEISKQFTTKDKERIFINGLLNGVVDIIGKK